MINDPIPETTTLKVLGATVTVQTLTPLRAWVKRHLCQRGKLSFTIPATRPGERYLCSRIELNMRVRHTFLLPGDIKKNWNDARAWAKSLDADLPDRVEHMMLFESMPNEFQPEVYWSNTQLSVNSDWAWCQSFNEGDQSSSYKTKELRVRAVRREFSDLVL